jgi:hypothetical protein
MTVDRENDKGQYTLFNTVEEAMLAYDLKKIACTAASSSAWAKALAAVVPSEKSGRCRSTKNRGRRSRPSRSCRDPNYVAKPMPPKFKGNVVLTTVGRCLFNDQPPRRCLSTTTRCPAPARAA